MLDKAGISDSHNDSDFLYLFVNGIVFVFIINFCFLEKGIVLWFYSDDATVSSIVVHVSCSFKVDD